ncbi:MAG: hypothetical protein HYZ16_01005 [Bacteroidetes bacterium]|jgi:hypothetical protein|nr:hypothetical protein [Bacteroidota bacterium]
MKKANLIVLATLALGLLAWWWLRSTHTGTNMPVPADYFQIKDTQLVDRIFMARPTGGGIDLVRKPGGWWVNGAFRADAQGLHNLFEPLVKMRIKSQLSAIDAREMIKEMTVAHVKVEVYKRGQLDRTIYVGNATADGLGSYVYAGGEEVPSPYIVHIPGWNGNILPRFFLDERDWRSKRLFHVQAVDLAYVDVWVEGWDRVPYRVEHLPNGQVDAYVKDSERDTSFSINPLRAKEVFMDLTQVYAESLLPPTTEMLDTVLNQAPLFGTITWKRDKDAVEQVLVVRAKPILVQEDKDKMPLYYAYVQGHDIDYIAVLQPRAIAKLFKKFDRLEMPK